MNTSSNQNEKSSVRVVVISAVIIIAIILGLFAVYKIGTFLIFVLVAIVISTGLDPIVTKISSKLNKRGKPIIPRGIATLLVMTVCFLILLTIIGIVLGVAGKEAYMFANNKDMQMKAAAWLERLSEKYAYVPNADQLLTQYDRYSVKISDYLVEHIPTIIGKLSNLIYFIVVIILIAFFTIFKQSIFDNLIKIVPPKYRKNTIISFNHAAVSMGGWIRGQIILAFIITVLIAAGMYIIGVPYAMIIAIVGGVCELIPMIGPYAAFWPAIIIILLSPHSLWQVIAVFVFFMVISQVENYYFTPKVMEKQVGLHPLTTIIALFIGGNLFGVIGALTAVPVAAALRIFILEVVYPMIEGKKFVDLYKETKPPKPEHKTTIEKIKDIITPEVPFDNRDEDSINENDNK